jgi:hypothetical protein
MPGSTYRGRGKGTENAPTASSSRLMLGFLGFSLTASHASASVSGTGPMAGIISGEGTMVRLVRKTPVLVGGGIGRGISAIPPSEVGLSTLGIETGEDASWDWLERSTVAVDGRFLLQGRGMGGVDSLACRRRGGSSESSAEARGLLPAPVGSECAKLGWLNFLNKREKDIALVQQVLTKGIVAFVGRMWWSY